jgi:uncharacterized membrane protein HdeD (DUF308 family)
MTEIPAVPVASAPPGDYPVVEDASGLFPWWTVLVLGTVSVLFGLAVLIWPHASLAVLAVLLGCWLLIAGAARIVGAFLPGAGLGSNVLSGVVGVILVIAGALCLRDLASSLAVIAVIVALTWLFSGLSGIVMAFQITGASRAALLVIGALTMLIGIVFLFLPRLSLATLVLTTGLSAIVVGIGELVVAFQLRKTRRF